ncbi:MAG: hypothetical protein RLZZ584_2630 [Pseudomonadota bacterium]
MHYLGLALYAEGGTDYYLLLPLLERMCSDLCLREVRGKVDVSPVLGLDHPLAYDDRSREQRFVDAARSALGQWSVLFIHTDGAGDVHRMRHQLVGARRKPGRWWTAKRCVLPSVPGWTTRRFRLSQHARRTGEPGAAAAAGVIPPAGAGTATGLAQPEPAHLSTARGRLTPARARSISSAHHSCPRRSGTRARRGRCARPGSR